MPNTHLTATQTSSLKSGRIDCNAQLAVTPKSSNNSGDSHNKSINSKTNFLSTNQNVLEETMHDLLTDPKITQSLKEESGILNDTVNMLKAIASPMQF